MMHWVDYGRTSNIHSRNRTSYIRLGIQTRGISLHPEEQTQRLPLRLQRAAMY